MLLEPSIERLKLNVVVQSTKLRVAQAILLSVTLSPDHHCKQVTESLVKRAAEVVKKISDYVETATAEESSILFKHAMELESTFRDIYLLIQSTSRRKIFFCTLRRKHNYVRSIDLLNQLERLLDFIAPKPCPSSSEFTSKKSTKHISPSFFSHANGVVANESAFYNVCGNMTLVNPAGKQDHGETGNGSLRVIAKEDIILTKEIYIGKGYRLHSAQTSGRAIAVKIYEKSGSTEGCMKAAKFNRKFMHSNIPQVIGVSPTNSEVSFLVISGEYEGTAESLVSFTLASDLKRGLILGLQTVAGLSSGLDYLHNMNFSFTSAMLDDFVVLVSQGGKISITFDVNNVDNTEERDLGSEINTDQGLLIFNGLCQKTFDAACKAHYDHQQIQRSTESDFDNDQSRFEELDDDEQSSSLDTQRESAGPSTRGKKSKPTTGQRRELVWKSHTDERVTLGEIARKFNGVLDEVSLGHGIMLTRRQGRRTTGTVHRCPGYTRQEITLSTNINRISIVSHLTPTPHEICPVCKMVVRSAEIFNCSCGRGDDESIPTMRCSTCFEWHHQPCVDINESSNGAFSCQDCRRNVEQSHPATEQLWSSTMISQLEQQGPSVEQERLHQLAGSAPAMHVKTGSATSPAQEDESASQEKSLPTNSRHIIESKFLEPLPKFSSSMMDKGKKAKGKKSKVKKVTIEEVPDDESDSRYEVLPIDYSRYIMEPKILETLPSVPPTMPTFHGT